MLRINDNIEAVRGERLLAEMSLLPQWRRQAALCYKHESGRRESTMAFRLLQDMTGLHDIEFSVGEHGKPWIKGVQDIHFNLSHCKFAVACVVDSVPVGVDIERVGRYSRRLAEYTLSSEEFHYIHYASSDTSVPRPSEDTDLLFTVLWTKKESLLKLIGTGITDNLRDVLKEYDGQVSFHTVVDIKRRYVCTETHFKEQEDAVR